QFIHWIDRSTPWSAHRISARTGKRPRPRYVEFLRRPSAERWAIPRNENLRPLAPPTRGDSPILRRGNPGTPELMLRNALLYLSDQQHIFKFVRNNRLAKSSANRFVARETLDTALSAVGKLNARGITPSLELLGGCVQNDAQA